MVVFARTMSRPDGVIIVSHYDARSSQSSSASRRATCLCKSSRRFSRTQRVRYFTREDASSDSVSASSSLSRANFCKLSDSPQRSVGSILAKWHRMCQELWHQMCHLEHKMTPKRLVIVTTRAIYFGISPSTVGVGGGWHERRSTKSHASLSGDSCLVEKRGYI